VNVSGFRSLITGGVTDRQTAGTAAWPPREETMARKTKLMQRWPSDMIGSYLFGVMALVGLIGIRNVLSSAY